MNVITYVSALWQQTHVLKVEDVEWFLKNSCDSLSDWQQNLSNARLKEYLERNPKWLDVSKRNLEGLQQEGILFTHYFGENYPVALRSINDPPLLITYQGSLGALKPCSLAVVGSRDASWEAVQWLERYLYKILKEYHLTIVSGAAHGIDQVAHQLANFCKRPTVAVFPSGLANLYPYNFSKHADTVLSQGGLLLSEYEAKKGMQKHHFYQRNRLIAALGRALLVVEARRKSGSLITAKYAIDMGKDVMTLPSSPMEESKWGTLDLLFDGALPVRDDADILAYLGADLAKSVNSDHDKNHIRHP